jgi:hypothetical protein
MLYTFSTLAQRLTQLGFPEATETGFRVMRLDLTKEEQAGNIEFKDDGIYLTIDGKEYKGYMYIKQPFIVNYGNKFPKFHITNCETIQEQRASGRFAHRYYWHNSNLVDLTDAQTGKEFNQVPIEICSKCKAQACVFDYTDTKGFFSLLDQQEQNDLNKEVEVDIFGYTLDWQQISREFRKEKEYTCESCHIKIDELSDRRFIHVHHKSGNKLNNRRNNLECLCVLCHAHKDTTHEHNFERRRMQADIKAFVHKYRQLLEELGNTFL